MSILPVSEVVRKKLSVSSGSGQETGEPKQSASQVGSCQIKICCIGSLKAFSYL